MVTPKDEATARRMRHIAQRDSKPEVLLRRELHRRGLRYRLHRRDLPGRPDICFGPAKVAVFVDGCFWHRCPEHYTAPKNNAEWWEAKIQANVARDRGKDEGLRDAGWLPVHVWEHEDPGEAADRVAALVTVRRTHD